MEINTYLKCLKPLILIGLLASGAAQASSSENAEIVQLGQRLFFDTNLSTPAGQACSRCHNPAAGWTGDTSSINAKEAIYPGIHPGRAGNRKPPSAAYATFSPTFHYDAKEELFVGGNFWDGRATGWLLGNPAAEQAQGPFLNPVEQNNANAQSVVKNVCQSSYGDLFRMVFGGKICDNTVNAYNAIGQAIAAFEGSSQVNAFTSKYDYYLKDPNKYPLSKEELWGLKLFEDKKKGNCAACHPSQPDAKGNPPLFTDFTFDNLGIPKNKDNPWYAMPKDFNAEGKQWLDPGLGGFLKDVPRYAKFADENLGKHKVPTLRNVDQRPSPDFVKAFGHNGYFKTLEDFMHFYNTRDTLARCEKMKKPIEGKNCWPAPEISVNINKDELGNIGLSEQEEKAIVVFMRALSDGWTPKH